MGESGRDDSYGHGLIDANSAYNLLMGNENENENGGNGNGDGDGNGATQCYDDPIGWHDNDGIHYNCEWYGIGENCVKYGDDFRNMGKTANMACCSCGGGTFFSGTETTDGPSMNPSPNPSPKPSPKPSPQPKGNNGDGDGDGDGGGQSSITCGCPRSCTSDVLARPVGREGLTLLHQIRWLQDIFDFTEIEACIFMCVDLFNGFCDECDPSTCSSRE